MSSPSTATPAQLADLTTSLPGYEAYDLRLLSAGGLIVAVGEYVVQLEASASINHTYEVTNEYSLSALSLDPDGTSFWASSQSNPYLYKFTFGTTNPVATLPIFTGLGVAGLAVHGEPRVAASPAPALSIAFSNRTALLSWPAGAAGYALQYVTSLASTNWTDLPTATNGVALPLTNSTRFFRLAKP